MKDLTVIDQFLMVKAFWRELESKYSIGKGRSRDYVIWRHAFSVACVENTTLSLMKIGETINKDHASIIHATKQHEMNYLYDTIYQQRYLELTEELGELVARYQEVMQENISKRVINIHGEKSVESLLGGYTKQIQRLKTKHSNDTEALKKELAFISRQLKSMKSRNESLSDELLRVKNLI